MWGGGSEEGDPPADGWIKEEKKQREDRERGGTRPAWSPAPPVINVVTPTLMKLIIS